MKDSSAVTVSVTILAILGVVTAAYVAREVAAPAVLALVAGIVLAPLTDRLAGVGMPRSAAALVSFGAGVVAMGALVLFFQPVAQRIVDSFPTVQSELNSAFHIMQANLRGLEELSENVRDMVEPGGEAGAAAADTSGGDEGGGAAEAIPTIQDVMFMAPGIIAQAIIFLGVLFFFLLSRPEIYQFAARRLAPADRRSEAAMRLSAAERFVARYFITVATINAGLGAIVAVAMMAIGMPSPVIWGIAAFLLNFLLYIGPAAMVVALTIVGIVVFDGAYVALPVAIYVLLNLIESQFVTPSLVGKTMSVNPLLIFLSITFLLWLWGPMGAIVAIPLLLWGIVLTTDIRVLRAARKAEADGAHGVEPVAGLNG